VGNKYHSVVAAQNIDEPPESLGMLGNDSLGSDIKCATNLASSLQTASTPSVTTCEDDLDDHWLEDDLPEVNTAMISLDNSHSPSMFGIFGCLYCCNAPCTTALEEVVLDNADRIMFSLRE